MKSIKSILALLVITLFCSPSLFSQMAITSAKFDSEIERSTGSIPKINSIYKVTELKVDATIEKQMAIVSVSQTIQNVSGRQIEVEMLFPLPAKGAIQDFILMVDGKEMPGKLMDKDEARKIYEGIVRRKKDPALMEYAGYGLYKTSVFPVPVGGSRTITLKYSLLCSQRLGNVNFIYPFSTQKFSNGQIGKLSLTATIKDEREIKNVYSPTHIITIDKTNPNRVVVKFEQTNVIPQQDFKLYYLPTNNEVGISMLSYRPEESDEGWFMMLAGPSIKNKELDKIAKDVILVIDKSGSMSGDKIEHAKKAAQFIINNLNENDRFNLVIYESNIEVYSNEMLKSDKENVKNADAFVNSISASGGTNINEALKRALSLIEDSNRPSYILFLTDGLPTVGETNEMKISKNIIDANKQGTKIFPFGVGYDVNARLLDRICEQNNGMPTYIKPGGNLEISISEFYRSIKAPVLTDIEVKFAASGIKEIYPVRIPDLFEGGQIELFGKYTIAGKTKVTITGNSFGEKKSFVYDIEFVKKGEGAENIQIEKIWATRKIGFLIDQIDLNGEKDELVKSLVELSKKYGILTPYTSFLAREDVDIHNIRENTISASGNLKKLEQVSGNAGVGQRSYKQTLKNNSVSYDYEEVVAVDEMGDSTTVSNMQNVGGRAFYQRNGVWVDGTLSESQEKNAKEIKQFSTEYFDLARNNSADLNQYLTFDDEVIININGSAYRIVK